MIARLRHGVALGLFALLSQCAPKDPTGIYVTLNIDPMITRQTIGLVVSVFNANTNVVLSRTVLGRTTALQYTVFVDESGRANKVRIEVEGFETQLNAAMLPMPGSGAVLDRVVVTYTADQILDVTMNLTAACRTQGVGSLLTMPCPADQHCVPSMGMGMGGPLQAGMCVPATVPTTRHTY